MFIGVGKVGKLGTLLSKYKNLSVVGGDEGEIDESEKILLNFLIQDIILLNVEDDELIDYGDSRSNKRFLELIDYQPVNLYHEGSYDYFFEISNTNSKVLNSKNVKQGIVFDIEIPKAYKDIVIKLQQEDYNQKYYLKRQRKLTTLYRILEKEIFYIGVENIDEVPEELINFGNSEKYYTTFVDYKKIKNDKVKINVFDIDNILIKSDFVDFGEEMEISIPKGLKCMNVLVRQEDYIQKYVVKNTNEKVIFYRSIKD